MDCVLSIDQGTQSSRVYLYDSAGKAFASSQREFVQQYPQRGWCEHDPYTIIDSVNQSIQGALEDASRKVGKVNIKAIGITNQRETTIIWRRSTGKPCHNAIVWLDTRTRRLCHELIDKHGIDHFRPVTGLPISTYFSAFKVKWLLDNVAEVQAAVAEGDAMIGTVDSWLIYNLTGGVGKGVHVTDVTNASRTCLLDLSTLQWSEAIAAEIGVPVAALPRVCSSSEHFGEAAEGPLAGVPICGCLGDQHAALLGQRCTKGYGKNTYGTGCFLLVHTGEQAVPSSTGLLTTVGYQLGPAAAATFALEGAIAIAGMAVAWLRDQMGLIERASDIEELAAAVPDSGGVYFVPAFGGLLAPHWRDDARGVLIGMSQGTNKSHLARAVLEAIAFQTLDVLEAVRGDSELSVDRLRVDGGATQNDLLMQIQADIAQVEVVRPAFQETTSLGAAFAAGLAVGVYSEAQLLGDGGAGEMHEEVEVFKPQKPRDWAERKYSSWNKAVQLSFGLADLE
eukprot:jgi/Ulvmu1/12863/UM098_0048.1